MLPTEIKKLKKKRQRSICVTVSVYFSFKYKLEMYVLQCNLSGATNCELTLVTQAFYLILMTECIIKLSL